MLETLPNNNPITDPSLTADYVALLQASQPSGDREELKTRLSGVWSEFNQVKQDPELMALFDRQTILPANIKAAELLAANSYPTRSNIEDLDMGEWQANLNPKFVKDGYMYLLRGDNPGQGTKGFYARTFGYARKITAKLAEDISKPEEVGYVLYGDERYLDHPQPHVSTVAGELAFRQSATGGSSFISTTTNLERARAGTGNRPTAEQKEATEVYIIRVPTSSIINSNTGNHFGLEEDEYLVADYVLPDEIVARFPRDAKEDVYNYMHALLDVSEQDLKIRPDAV